MPVSNEADMLTHLQRVAIERSQHDRRRLVADAFHLERRDDGTRIKEVWMVADLTQLHQNIDDAHVVPSRQRLLCSETQTSFVTIQI